ncbi:MAG TPA: hypothetical protein VGM12_02690 [Trebonia sp.]
MAGVAAWAGGTAIAVCVAWFGANVVVRDAGVRSGMPVVNAAVLPPSPAPSTAVTPPPAPSPGTASGSTASGRPGPAATAPAGTGSPAVPTSASTVTGGPSGASASGTAGPQAQTTPAARAAGTGAASAAPAVAGSPSGSATVRAYTLTGGRVTLDVTGDSVQLVTAVPDDGYSVQTWSGTDWLRVDFSAGTQASSLIASWYEQTPAITVTN